MLKANDLSPALRRQYGLHVGRRKRSRSRIGRLTRAMRHAERSGKWLERDGFGVFQLELITSLLTANEIVETHGRALAAYRIATHRAVYETVIDTFRAWPAQAMLAAPCEMSIYRRAQRLVDNDALEIMFKFLTDGLRYAHVIPDDDPLSLTSITRQQDYGSPLIRVMVTGPVRCRNN